MNSRTWIIFHAYCSCSRKGRRRRRRKGDSLGWRGRSCCDEVVRLVVAAVELEEKTLTAEEERRRRKSTAGRRRRGRRGEGKKRKLQKPGRSWFFGLFWTRFLLFQAMKSTSIYRRWKRAILSTWRKNFSPWFSWEGSQPLAQSRYHELKIYRQKLIE